MSDHIAVAFGLFVTQTLRDGDLPDGRALVRSCS